EAVDSAALQRVRLAVFLVQLRMFAEQALHGVQAELAREVIGAPAVIEGVNPGELRRQVPELLVRLNWSLFRGRLELPQKFVVPGGDFIDLENGTDRRGKSPAELHLRV